METVTVTDVSEPNQYGYATITFADGTEATTKDKKIREKAFQSRNTEVEVSISEVQKGNFTNRYLNMIDGVGRVAKTNGQSTTAASQKAATGPSRSEATQNTIGNQWAVGQAMAALLADPERTNSLPTDEELATVEALARKIKTIRDAI